MQMPAGYAYSNAAMLMLACLADIGCCCLCSNLTSNNLHGTWSSNWGSFQNLTVLDVSNNPELAGALPTQWGQEVCLSLEPLKANSHARLPACLSGAVQLRHEPGMWPAS